MTKALAEALVQLDDPETIEKILVAAGTDSDSVDPELDRFGQSTLPSLFERYLNRRKNRSPETRAQYTRTIPHFIEFAEQKGIETPRRISPDIVDDYVNELQSEFEPDATVLTYTKNVRAWLRWIGKRQMCDEHVYRILDKDELGLTPKARDEAFSEHTAKHILSKLRQQRRGSTCHALLELCWNAGPRIGDIHSLDVQDFNPNENTIQFRHRPESGTRLKNGNENTATKGDGERDIVTQESVVEAIQIYVRNERPEVTDAYDRDPLFATSHGRAAKSTLRRWVYKATSCRWSPEESTAQTCDGNCDPDSSVCPLSYYPHAIRRGAIVNHLSGGLRPDRASERFDVSPQVLKKHYDPRAKEKKLVDRSEAVRKAWTEW
ncbi:tyrosine-type recombinase/integrase [Natrialbaceae archaeon A-chndr2]